MIPLRTNDPEQQISREDRWNEIRTMMRENDIILELRALDPCKIAMEKFNALIAMDAAM